MASEDNTLTAPARFDVPEMFRLAGGLGKPSDMRDLLERQFGYAPSLTVIQMWKQRRTIPAAWQAAVASALVDEGHDFPEIVRRTLILP